MRRTRAPFFIALGSALILLSNFVDELRDLYVGGTRTGSTTPQPASPATQRGDPAEVLAIVAQGGDPRAVLEEARAEAERQHQQRGEHDRGPAGPGPYPPARPRGAQLHPAALRAARVAPGQGAANQGPRPRKGARAFRVAGGGQTGRRRSTQPGRARRLPTSPGHRHHGVILAGRSTRLRAGCKHDEARSRDGAGKGPRPSPPRERYLPGLPAPGFAAGLAAGLAAGTSGSVTNLP